MPNQQSYLLDLLGQDGNKKKPFLKKPEETDITRFLQGEPARKDATAQPIRFEGQKLSTQSPSEYSNEILQQQQLKQSSWNDYYNELQQKAIDDEYAKKSALERLELAIKTTKNTLLEIGSSLVEMPVFLGIVGLKEIGLIDDKDANTTFGDVRKLSEAVKTFYRIKEGITRKDLMFMQTQLDQQVVAGVTQVASFMVGAGIAGLAGRGASLIASTALASTDAYNEVQQAFDATDDIDVAAQTFINDLPYAMIDTATDRFVFLKGLMSPSIKTWQRAILKWAQGVGLESSTEALQQIGYNITAQELWDYSRSLLAGVEESAEVAAITSMFLGGATTMVEFKLTDPNLTPEEVMKLKEVRGELYKASERILSMQDLNKKIDQYRVEGIVFQHSPEQLRQQLNEIRKEETGKITIERKDNPAVVMDAFEGNDAKREAYVIKQKIKEATTPTEKVKLGMNFAIKSVLAGKEDLITSIQEGGYINESLKNALPTIKEMAKAGIGAGFLYWLTQNQDLLNDPTVMGALMLPMGALKDKGVKILGRAFATDINQEVGLISLAKTRLKSNVIEAIKNWDFERIAGSFATLGDVLDSPELAKVFPKALQTPVKFERMDKLTQGGYDPDANVFSFNIGRFSLAQRADLISQYELNKYLSPDEITEDVLIDAMAGTIIHEVQHQIEKEYKMAIGGNTISSFAMMSNQVLNKFVDDNTELFNNHFESIDNFHNKAVESLRKLKDNLKRINIDLETADDRRKLVFIANAIISTKNESIMQSFWANLLAATPSHIVAQNTTLQNLLKRITDVYSDPSQYSTKDRLNLLTFSTLELVNTIADYITTTEGISAVYDEYTKLMSNPNKPNNYGFRVLTLFTKVFRELPLRVAKRLGESFAYKIYANHLGEQRARAAEDLFLLEKIPQIQEQEGDTEFAAASMAEELAGDNPEYLTYAPKKPLKEIDFIRAYRDVKGSADNFILRDIQNRLNKYGIKAEQVLVAGLEGFYYTTASIYSGQQPLLNAVHSVTKPVEESVEDKRKTMATIKNAQALAQTLIKEGIDIPVGDIYRYLINTGRDILPDSKEIGSVIKEIKDYAKQNPLQNDSVLLTHYGDVVGMLDDDVDMIDEVVLDPEVAWREGQGNERSRYSQNIRVPRVFFYPLLDVKEYRNKLEASIVRPSAEVYHTFLPKNKIYALNDVGMGFDINPFNLPTNTFDDIEAAYRTIIDAGYDAAIYKTGHGDDIHLVTFKPLQAFRAPRFRVGITAHKTDENTFKYIKEASEKFAQSYAKGEIDQKSLETIVDATYRKLDKNLSGFGKHLNGIIEEMSPAIAVFDGAEASTYTEVTVDIAKAPDFFTAVTKTADALNQDAVHIILDGNKPANVPYGQVQSDYSMWQPQVTAELGDISYGDISTINRIFNESGYAGVTVSIEHGTAFIYNVMQGEENARQFIENSTKLESALKEHFPDARVTVSDIQLWSIGKSKESWGAVTTYAEIQSNLQTEQSNALVDSIRETYTENIRRANPSIEDKLTGRWGAKVAIAESRLFGDPAGLYDDINEGRVSEFIATSAFQRAANNGTTLEEEVNKIIQQLPILVGFTEDAMKIARSYLEKYDPEVSLQEAQEVNNAIAEYLNNPKDFTKQIGNLVVTTDANEAKKSERAILINTSRPLDVLNDKGFYAETLDWMRERFGYIATETAMKKYSDMSTAEQYRYALRDLSQGNPAYALDNLARKYMIRNADTYKGTLTYIVNAGESSVSRDINLTIPLGDAIKATNESNPYAVLELLSSLNDKPMLGKMKLDDVDLTDVRLPKSKLLEIWNQLTEGVVDPNKLLDITSIISGLLKLGWNIVKLGYNTLTEFTGKLFSYIGEKANKIGASLYDVILKIYGQSRTTPENQNDLNEILPSWDVRRLSKGNKEGSTQGFSEGNLHPEIQKQLDEIIEMMVNALGRDKRFRVESSKAKEIALKMIKDGAVKIEDIDGWKTGTVLPAEYAIAYRIMAENNFANSLRGLSDLAQKYGNTTNIPKDIFTIALDNLLQDLRRWAKVRATISEAGRTVRLATEEYTNYIDALIPLLQEAGVDKDVIQLVKDLPDEQKSTDIFGMILYNFALSNPLTHAVNLMGNFINLGANLLTDFLFDPTSAEDMFRAFPDGIARGVKEIVAFLQGKEAESNKFFEMQPTNKKAYWKLALPTTWLTISDAMFRNYAEEYKLRRNARVLEEKGGIQKALDLLHQLANNPDAVLDKYTEEQIDTALDALEYAQYYGKYITYQLDPETSLGEAFIKFSQHPVTRMIMLFAKTPLNIMKESFHWSPLYLPKIAADEFLGKKPEERTLMEQEKLKERERRVIVGSVIFGTLLSGMASGLLKVTGDEPEDEFERELWAKRGFKPYHIYINFNGKYTGFSYQGIEPFRMMINLMRGFHDIFLDPKAAKYIDDADILKKTSFLMVQLWNNINDASFMTGINEWYRTQESPKNASEYLERLVVNLLIPNALTFQRELPEEIRDALNARGKELYITENIWDRIKNKVGFGLQKDLVPRTDFFGDKVYNKFERFPLPVSELKADDPKLQELYDWLDKHRLVVPSYSKDPVIDQYGDNAALKEMISTKIGQKLKQLVIERFDRWKERYEEVYDQYTQKAIAEYGEENARKYKTIGQVQIDQALQENLRELYDKAKNEVIRDVIGREEYRGLNLRIREKEKILKIELDENKDKILEIETQLKDRYIRNKDKEKK